MTMNRLDIWPWHLTYWLEYIKRGIICSSRTTNLLRLKLLKQNYELYISKGVGYRHNDLKRTTTDMFKAICPSFFEGAITTTLCWRLPHQWDHVLICWTSYPPHPVPKHHQNVSHMSTYSKTASKIRQNSQNVKYPLVKALQMQV